LGLFKEAKKPVLRSVATGAGEVSPLRPLYDPKLAPCVSGCPNGHEMRELMVRIAQARDYAMTSEQAFEQAWRCIARRNPFPAVCGRVCPHPCEDGCNRKAKEGAVAIHAIERSIGDFAIARRLGLPRLSGVGRKERIVVAGAGPAGLSCAYQLARRGYSVTVLDAFREPGGTLRYGIPRYRLPRQVLDAEIGGILELGIELKCNCWVGRDVSLEELRRKYQAVFVGVGAQKAVKLHVPGEDAANVYSGIDFLNRVNRGAKVDVGSTVIVVGAGNTAIDAARLCKRLGAEVTMVGAEMTASESESQLARGEGVRAEPFAVPTEITRHNGRATGLRLVRVQLREPDSSGLPRFLPLPGTEFVLQATCVVVAISQELDASGLEGLHSGNGWLTTDDWGRTAVDGVFAGGDATGLGLVADAIAQGRLAAEAIDARFEGRPLEKAPVLPPISADKLKLDWYATAPRHQAEPVAIGEPAPQTEVEPGLAPAEVVEEAKRCMSCGMCMDCEACWMYCSNSCFIRLPKGEHYKIKLELCNGCKKCADVCPSRYIEMN
jgi:NADPH-dependent glutamate synthase beta subunit-like oxidoreductase